MSGRNNMYGPAFYNRRRAATKPIRPIAPGISCCAALVLIDEAEDPVDDDAVSTVPFTVRVHETSDGIDALARNVTSTH